MYPTGVVVVGGTAPFKEVVIVMIIRSSVLFSICGVVIPTEGHNHSAVEFVPATLNHILYFS